MGRKSKKKGSQDARGYAQGSIRQRKQNQSASSTATAMSTKTHDEMKALLREQHSNASAVDKATSTLSIAAPSDRFASRLANIVEELDELKFSPSQVERAVQALRYEITLETALDWLCLNLTTLELPALFTDGQLRQDLSTVTTVDSLTVLQESTLKNEADGSPEENVLAVDHACRFNDSNINVNQEEDAQREQQDKEHKNWLLQQYAYEEEDEERDDESDVDDVACQTADTIIQADQSQQLSPDEKLLEQEEKSLAELEADLGNDANNYMRSKAEIKLLQIQAKKSRQKVNGLRKRVERNRLRQQQSQGVENENDKIGGDTSVPAPKEGGEVIEVIEDNGTGGMFDIFAPDNDDVNAEESTEKENSQIAVVEELPEQRDFRIPKGWTGTTPQKKLDELMKKQKLPKPKYTKLPRINDGYVLSAILDKKQPPQTWEAKARDFDKGSSIKDYLATQALYTINPTVQLYSIFPQPFRDLWLSWMDQKKEERDEAQKVENEAKQARIDHLLSLITGMQTDGNNGVVEIGVLPVSNVNDKRQPETDDPDNDDSIMENWDDESVDGSLADTAKTQPSAKGNSMRDAFLRRQSTPLYQKMKSMRDELPMSSFRSNILETVENNRVSILCAETGAGKSTQCGQFILEEALLQGLGDTTQIICTQPRRVAATSLAERVAEEMCDKIGQQVGYQIRMESKRSSQTRLLFCTTGVILRRLQDDPLLSGVTHVICDEVHERSSQIDLLLIILRQLLQTTRQDLKVILMSATLETDLFTSFFHGAPIISVPGRTFPVSSYYLEDLLDATGHIIEEGSRYAFRENYNGGTASLWVTTRGGEKRKEIVDLNSQTSPLEVSDAYTGYQINTRRSMERVNEEVINFDLIEDVLKLITSRSDCDHDLAAPDGADLSQGSILIFLPGLGEIKALMDRLDASRVFRDRQRFDIIPLHSTLSSSDQRRAFVPSLRGCRKIICATNIAETSVTIPDAVYVIDTGRVREVRRNKRTSTSMLVQDFICKSSAKQRQGRAGRVQPGVCLKLYSRVTAERMKPQNEPELCRVPLEEVCVSILASGFADSCWSFLDQAPQPPSIESVQAATDALIDVGAIERVSTGTAKKLERLTPLGYHLAKLPVDVKLGKMLVFGAFFQCIDPVLTIAASLSSKSPFSAFVTDAALAKAKQRSFEDPDSDFLTYCNVFDAYSEAAARSASEGKRFCRDNYLNHLALREISDARNQFTDLLRGIGFIDSDIVDHNVLKACHSNRNAKKSEVIHSVILAGLYPNILHLEKSASMNHSMWHKDERVYFHGASVNSAKKQFSSKENWVVFYEKFGTSNRTSVSTTAFVNPFALLLFGGSIVINHAKREVIVDDWMNIGMSAQTSVMLKELRKKVDSFLQRRIEITCDSTDMEQLGLVDGIVKILVSSN